VSNRLFGEDEAYTCTVLHSLRQTIAVVNLELQVRARGNAQSITGRARLGKVSRQVDARDDILLATGETTQAGSSAGGTAVIGDRRIRL
jgi:hypothetical protein